MTNETSQVDLIVRAAAVATMNPEREILRDGAVAVLNGAIVAVGTAKDVEREFEADRTIGLPNSLLTPGFIDGHNHVQDYLIRGLIDDIGDMFTRVGTYVVPFELGIMHDEAYVAGCANFAEMLLNGTTCFMDAAGRQTDAIAKAARDIGIRGVVASANQDISGIFKFPVDDDLEAMADRATGVVERWDGAADGRIRAFISIDNPGSVSDELIKILVEKAKALNIGVLGHFHGRTPDDNNGQRSPLVQRYEGLGVFSCKPTLTHIGWLPPEDIAVLADNDVKAIHCPAQSLFGGQGFISRGCIPELIEAGISVGLGSDAACISNFLDPVRIMYLAACGHRDPRMDPLMIGAHKAFEMGTIDGAHAISWGDEIGSLEVGKRADMVVFDTSRPEWQPRGLSSPIASLVYAGTGASVHTVIVDGKVVVDAGTLTTIDRDRLVKETAAATDSVFERLGFESRAPKWPVRA